MDYFETIGNLAKRRGFFYPGSEIYGGLSGTWDFGPLGVELKRNIKNLFWKTMVQDRTDVVGLDGSILLSPKVWEASGHLEAFADPLVECKKCNSRFRADTLVESKSDFEAVAKEHEIIFSKFLEQELPKIKIKVKEVKDSTQRIKALLEIIDSSNSLQKEEKDLLLEIAKKENRKGEVELASEEVKLNIFDYLFKELEGVKKHTGLITQIYLNRFVVCPKCSALGMWVIPKSFNLLMEAYLGVVEGEKQKTYLRGEITQSVHVNFKNVLDSSRVKIPFGIAQIGRAFRNEITPSQTVFRAREFEQMELQFYVKPEEAGSMEWFEFWKGQRIEWHRSLGFRSDHLRFKDHGKDELAHYARAAADIEYLAGDEWKEMEGVHHRGDWDIRRHMEFSKQDLTYFDEEDKKKYIPWVIETSGGVDRTALFLLMDAYREEEVKEGEKRVVLKLSPRIAPYKAAVFPLLSNKPPLVEYAKEIYAELKKLGMIAWDERGNIGKRYRTQDEIGTPYCITVDFDSLEKKDVTVRDRDTMEQVRMPVAELSKYLSEKIN